LPKTPAIAIDIALLLTRLTVGGYLLLAGVGKASREINDGLGSFYNGSFSRLQPAWLPDLLAAPYGYALPWLEIVVGSLLVVGLFGRAAAVATGLMIASFTIALAMKFGLKAEPAEAPHPFSSNYIQIAVCLLLTVLGPGGLSIDRVAFGRRKAVPAAR